MEFPTPRRVGILRLQAFVRSAGSENPGSWPRLPAGEFVWPAPLVRTASWRRMFTFRRSVRVYDQLDSPFLVCRNEGFERSLMLLFPICKLLEHACRVRHRDKGRTSNLKMVAQAPMVMSVERPFCDERREVTSRIDSRYMRPLRAFSQCHPCWPSVGPGKAQDTCIVPITPGC